MKPGKQSLKIVPDQSSYSGYSIASFDEPDKPGIPASKFEVELWKELTHTRHENEILRKFVDKLRETSADRTYGVEEILYVLDLEIPAEDQLV